jgi:glutathione S-transferase
MTGAEASSPDLLLTQLGLVKSQLECVLQFCGKPKRHHHEVLQQIKTGIQKLLGEESSSQIPPTEAGKNGSVAATVPGPKMVKKTVQKAEKVAKTKEGKKTAQHRPVGKIAKTTDLENDATRVTLYVGAGVTRNGELHANCTFSMYTRFFLLEAGIPFKVELINLDDKPAWFVEGNPGGTCPAAVIDGEWICDSKLIVAKAKELFAESSEACQMMVQECGLDWSGLQGRFLGKFFGWLFASGSEADQSAAKAGVTDVLTELSSHLGDGRLLICGDKLSEADTSWLPLLCLSELLLNEYKGFDVRARYPHLAAYLDRGLARPLFRRCLGDDYVEVALHTFDTHPKFAGKFTRPRITLYVGAGVTRNGELHANCTFSMYTRFFLLEAGIPFRHVFIDLNKKPTWFIAENPGGTCPAAIIDGQWVIDSKMIVAQVYGGGSHSY